MDKKYCIFLPTVVPASGQSDYFYVLQKGRINIFKAGDNWVNNFIRLFEVGLLFEGNKLDFYPGSTFFE